MKLMPSGVQNAKDSPLEALPMKTDCVHFVHFWKFRAIWAFLVIWAILGQFGHSGHSGHHRYFALSDKKSSF